MKTDKVVRVDGSSSVAKNIAEELLLQTWKQGLEPCKT